MIHPTTSASSEPHQRHYHSKEEAEQNEATEPEPLPPTPSSSAAKARAEELEALSHQYEELAGLSEASLAQYTCLMTAYQRALETKREDGLIADPYAEALAGEGGRALSDFFSKTMQVRQGMRGLEDYVGIRSRFLDEALLHRDARITQVVLLGAGLDTRAFRLETLRECAVFELDAGAAMLDRKKRILADRDAQLMAKEYHPIVADLGNDEWDVLLQAEGFQSDKPTFWVLEGLLPYMDQSSIVRLLKTIDALSARHSHLWADLCSQGAVKYRRPDGSVDPDGMLKTRAVKFGEDDPMHGVLTLLPWQLSMQVDLAKPGEYFGRQWMPLAGKASESEGEQDQEAPPAIAFYFVEATKTKLHPEPAPLP